MIGRGVLGLAVACGVLGASPGSRAAETEEGKRLYRVHCLACHGETGRGDGPMRNQMELEIPDLTTISKSNQGEFPTERIHELIDGRYETPAHGTRAMPVWGFTFQATGRDTDQEAAIQEMIAALTQYLDSLQIPNHERD